MKLHNATDQRSKFNRNLKSVLKFNLIIFFLIVSFYLALSLTSLDLNSVFNQFIRLENDQRVKVKSFQVVDSSFGSFVNFSSFFDNDVYLTNNDTSTVQTIERSIKRSIRSIPIRTRSSKSRKRRGNLTPKRKVKRIVFRVDNLPFLKFLSTSNLFRKRYIKRNIRSSQSNARLPNRLRKWHRADKTYNDNEILRLSSINSKEVDKFSLTLEKILKVRVPGTNGHREVNEFIINSMKELGWSVEEDVFKDQTPIGEITFRNIIATHNPKACKRLVFACHYDSKYFKSGKFLGATDSAVPCAMMIEMARNLHSELERGKNNDLSLQFIFFDGEEAFKKWTDTDSIYGARHLAAKWNRLRFPATEQDKNVCPNKKIISELDRIELFVLLDLLGTASPNFHSFFPQTSSVFKRLYQIEHKLNTLQQLESQSKTNYFQRRPMLGGMISDDHVPFMKLDVDILHIIPYPFPSVWHKLSDNESALHQPTINNLMRIFQLFISQYLHL